MRAITQSWITEDGYRVYKAGQRYYIDPARLRPYTPGAAPDPPETAPERVADLVAEAFGLTATDLRTKSQEVKYSYPRDLLIYLLWADYCLPWRLIQPLVNRSRTGIVNAYERTRDRQFNHPEIKRDLCNLRAKLLSPAS